MRGPCTGQRVRGQVTRWKRLQKERGEQGKEGVNESDAVAARGQHNASASCHTPVSVYASSARLCLSHHKARSGGSESSGRKRGQRREGGPCGAAPGRRRLGGAARAERVCAVRAHEEQVSQPARAVSSEAAAGESADAPSQTTRRCHPSPSTRPPDARRPTRRR